MTLDIIHAVCRLILTAIIVVKITRFGETLNPVERVGLGMMGGAGLLTIGVIWERQESPFADWSPLIFTIGAILLLAGRTWRDWRHEHRNITARQQARDYLQARGKL